MPPRQMLGHVLLDQPRRAVKMNQQRHRFVDINVRADEKARALQTLQINASSGNRRLLNSRMRPRVFDHRRRRLRCWLLRADEKLSERKYRNENDDETHWWLGV